MLIAATGPEEGDEIVVRAEPSDRRTPASFTTVVRPGDTPGQLTGLADLLRGAAGVDLRSEGGAGRAAEVRLRGAGAHQVAAFLDDIPLSGARGGALDLATIPPAYLDRVEIVRGAAAAAYGSGAMGGVLRLRTREVGPGSAVHAAARLGSHQLRQLDAAFAHGERGFDLLGVGRLSAAEGDFPFEDVNGRTRARRNHDHALGAALARVRVRTARGRLSLHGEGLADERGEPGHEQFQNPTARSRRRRALGAASWTGRPLDDWEVGALVSGSRATYAFDDPRLPGVPAPGLLGIPERYEADDTTIAAGLRVAWTGSARHRPALAIAARRDAAKTRVEGAQFFVKPRDEARLGAAAVLSETLRVGPASLSGAVRVDDTDDRAPIVVPQAGGAWSPLDWLVVRANAGRVFRDPGLDELYFYGAGIVGNPDLRPEDGLAWDAGLQLRLGDHVALEAVWFEERYDRLILFVQETATLVRARDDFGARVTGQELSATLGAGPLRLDATYTHLDTAFDFAPHPPLPFRPAHRVFARATAEAGEARTWVAWDARGERTTDRFGGRKIDGYGFWEVGVDGPIGGGFRAGLEIRNALDERGAVDAVQRPLPGRTVLFALRLDAADAARGGER